MINRIAFFPFCLNKFFLKAISCFEEYTYLDVLRAILCAVEKSLQDQSLASLEFYFIARKNASLNFNALYTSALEDSSKGACIFINATPQSMTCIPYLAKI